MKNCRKIRCRLQKSGKVEKRKIEGTDGSCFLSLAEAMCFFDQKKIEGADVSLMNLFWQSATVMSTLRTKELNLLSLSALKVGLY